MHDDTIVPEADRLPFDAERAKAGDPVCTAEGKRVRGALGYNPKRVYPFRGHLAGHGELSWDETGLYWGEGGFDPCDLRMIRQPVKNTPPRFCRDCKHFLPEYNPSPNVTMFNACGRTDTSGLAPDWRQHASAWSERQSGVCGAEGLYFESRPALSDEQVEAKDDRQHASDCATNNAPALPPGPCDCAAASTRYDPALCEPFDRARAENGAAVCDGNGVPHRIICFDRKDGNCPIITLSMSGGREVVHSFSNSGRFGNSSMATAADLRMAPLKTKRWWIVSWKKSRDERPVDGRSGCSEMFATQDAAETYARNICPRHSPATVSYTDITDDSNA